MYNEESAPVNEATESTTPQIDISGGIAPAETPAAEVQPTETAEQGNASGDADTVAAYEPFTLPEGVAIADEDLAVFSELGQKYGLDQGGAQQLIDLSLAVQQRSIDMTLEDLKSKETAERESWRDELHRDKELGGDKLAQTQKFVDAFQATGLASDGMVKVLLDKGLAAHPEVVRFMANIGRMVSEDPVAFGGGEPGGQDGRTSEQRMFANSGHE